MRDTPAMLRELNVVAQRYQAVLEVLDDIPVIEVAERFGVARQTVHRWVACYWESGLAGLADRAHASKAHPWQTSAEVEAVICGAGAGTSTAAGSGRQRWSCGRWT